MRKFEHGCVTPQHPVKRWKLIPETNLSALPGLCNYLSIPINSHEIIILGGSDYNANNIQLFDTQTDTVTSIEGDLIDPTVIVDWEAL